MWKSGGDLLVWLGPGVRVLGAGLAPGLADTSSCNSTTNSCCHALTKQLHLHVYIELSYRVDSFDLVSFVCE